MSNWKTINSVVLCFVLSSIAFAYSGGSGTTSDPFQIANKADLLELAASTWDYDKAFILTADIDLSEEVFTTAVIAADMDNATKTFQGADFRGIFDGNRHVIRNLTINPGNMRADFLGLFGFLRSGSVVKNLGVENVVITNVKSDSMIAGGLAGANCGMIVNCYATGSVMSGELAGGLVGYSFNGSITESYAIVNVHARFESGGLVGYNNAGIIRNCYSRGTITASESTSGGLIGRDLWGTIITCYSDSEVSGKTNVGGLIGNDFRGEIVNSVWNMESSGCQVSAGGSGITAEQMRTRATFTGPGWTSGYTNNALMFDGINDYVEIPLFHGVSGIQSRTCTAWIKPQPTNDDALIISWGESANGKKWMFRVQPTGELAVGVWGGYIQGSTVLTDGLWHHVAATLDNDGDPRVDKVKLYVDGRLEANVYYSSTQAIDTSSMEKTYIGSRYSNSEGLCYGFYEGLIDDLCIYDRALDAEELQQSPLNGLIAHWTMDEFEGTVLHDSVSSFHGQLRNMNGLGWDFSNETENGTGNFWRMCADGADYPRLSWEFIKGDFACPGGVAAEDFDVITRWWLVNICNADNNFCGGTDINNSGVVDLIDLAVFVEHWLQ